MTRDFAVVIPAAGHGGRFGGEENKLWSTIDGRPLWRWSLDAFTRRHDVATVVMAVADDDRDRIENDLGNEPFAVRVVAGGRDRMDSVRSAVDAVGEISGLAESSIAYVAIHDAARPLVRQSDIDGVFQTTRRTGAATLANPVTGSLHRRDLHGHSHPVDRREMYAATTPQAFRLDLLRLAYDRHNGRPATDDTTLVARGGHPVTLVPGRTDNLKITHPEDLAIARAIAASLNTDDSVVVESS